MHRLIQRQGPLALRTPLPAFEALVRTVVEQQSSVKAASTIADVLTLACDGQMNPNSIQSLSVESLRAAGLSQSKAECVLAPCGVCRTQRTSTR